MSTLVLQLPDDIHDQLRAAAERGGVSVQEFLTNAAAEKLAALKQWEFLHARAAHGSPEEFRRLLAVASDVSPEPGDELPSGWTR